MPSTHKLAAEIHRASSTLRGCVQTVIEFQDAKIDFRPFLIHDYVGKRTQIFDKSLRAAAE